MYLAIQAKNIAFEKYYHRYYKLYRKHVCAIMKMIEHTTKNGGHKIRENARENSKTEIKVLKQIAKELSMYDFHCLVSSEKEEGSYSQWFIEVDWK